MIPIPGLPAPNAEMIRWSLDHVLEPCLRNLEARGELIRPSSCPDTSSHIDALKVLHRTQIDISLEGQRPNLSALLERAEFTQSELYQLFDSVRDWAYFGDDLWLRPSERGSVPLDGCVCVLKSVPRETSGGNVFATKSPAYPTQVVDALRELDLLPPKRAPINATGSESTAYLMVMSPAWAFARRVKSLPEGTFFDPQSYPEEIREVARAALLERLGKYEVSTRAIVRDRMLGSLLRSIKAHGRASELPLRVESGLLRVGTRGVDFRFAGSDLELILHVEELHGIPFFDLPRAYPKTRRPRERHRQPDLDAPFRIKGEACSFLFGDDVELAPDWIAYVAQGELGHFPLKRRLRGLFRIFSPTVVALGGADADSVEYLYAVTRVGRPKARPDKRVRIGILMRSVGGALTHGWGVRTNLHADDELAQRKLVEQAERHVHRMKPGGQFDQAVDDLRAAGVQKLGIELPVRRTQREGLIMNADVLAKRAVLHLGLGPRVRGGPEPQKH